jgi:hypothetical protein
MNAKEVILEAAGSLSAGTVFNRKAVYESLIARGYATRTAENALTPSRNGGMLNRLLASNAIAKHGPNTYRLIDPAKIIEPQSSRPAKPVKMYQGNKRPDWKHIGLMSDPEPGKVEWLLCGDRYAPGCWNLKLYADGKVPNKANYWLQYRNGSLHGSDAITLKAHMRDVYDYIIVDIKEMEEFYV